MYALLILTGIACVLLTLFYIRLCTDIRSLCGQLREIQRGSHLELTVNSRQRTLLALCRQLNQVLSAKDRDHIQYEKAERQLKQNITDLAHDIRTPLTGASGYIQLAEECEDSGKREHYLQAASFRLTELEDMLEKLFLFAKLTNEEFVFPGESLKNIPVYPLLENCLLSFYTAFEEKGIAPRILFSSESFCVPADEDALKRIFLNLIQNALVHGAGGLTIREGTTAFSSGEAEYFESGSIKYSRMDSAEPYEPEEASRRTLSLREEPVLIFENPVRADNPPDPAQMFERFYKADSARGKSSSGLGLFIVRELMRRMGGEAEAELLWKADRDAEATLMLRIILRFPVLSDITSSVEEAAGK